MTRIDVGVIPHVERARRAGADGDGKKGHQRQPGMNVARRRDQAGKRRENDERHHPRLQQRQIIADRTLAAAGGGPRRKYGGMSLIASMARPPIRRPRLRT